MTDGPAAGIAVLGDTLFVAGSFGYVGPPTGQVAALDKATGEADLSWPRFESVDLNTIGIASIIADGAGGFFVGGRFEWASGESRLNLARVRADGTLDPDFRPDPQVTASSSYRGVVRALAFDSTASAPSGQGVLYVAGDFDRVGGQPRRALAALDAETGAVLPLTVTFTPSGSPFPPSVSLIAVRDGVLYVQGDYGTIGGATRGVAALDAATGDVLAWDPQLTTGSSASQGAVSTVAFADSTLYIGGPFDFVRGQRRHGVAEVSLADPADGTGGAPTAWTPDPPSNESMRPSALLVTTTDVYAAGYVSGGAPLTRMDRATAMVERLFMSEAGSDGLTYGASLAFEPDAGPSGAGLLYLGAERRTPWRPVVVAIDVATHQLTGLEVLGGSGGDPNKAVRTLVVEPGTGGRIVAGGNFLSIGGFRRPGLAALNLSTGRPTDFSADIENGFAEDLALSPDGRFLYAYTFELGGAALSLKEYDLLTGAVREFFPPEVAGSSAAGRSAPPAPGEAARVLPVPALTTSGHRAAGPPAPPPPASRGGGAPYVANGPSALVVTDDRVCLSIALCLDRATTDVVWQQSGAIYLARDNGDVLLAPDGGAGGTLYLATPLAEIPLGTSRAGFVAIDYATGALLPFDVQLLGQTGAEGFAVARLDTDGDGPARPTVYFGGDRISTVQGQSRSSVFAVAEPTAGLLPWAPNVSGAQSFPFEPVMAMLALPRRAEDGGGGVVYVGGSFGVVNGESSTGPVAAFDAVSGEHLSWRVDGAGADPTSFHARSLLASPRHGALFVAGGFQGILRGSGHAGVVAVTPAAPFLPVAGEPGTSSEAGDAALALAGPNPFSSQTALALTLPSAQHVEAALYDVLGRRVAVLYNGPLGSGTHSLTLSASSLPAGLYVARVVGESFSASRALTLVR